MKVSVDFQRVELDVSPPDYVSNNEEALKEWLLENCKKELLANMKLGLEPSKLEKRLDLLDKISHVQRQFLQSIGPKIVFGCLLEGLLELMDSEYGFIGEVKYESDGTMYLQTHAITNIAWDAATRAFYNDNVDSGLKFYNLKTLFGNVMVTKQVVIANAPRDDPRASGVPPGHPPLNHFLGIPFFNNGGELYGMVGIANKPGGYSDADVEFLEPFTVTCSNLVQAYWQIQQNRHLINTLEEKVRERTHELELANENLESANRKVLRASAAQLEHFACMSHEIRTPLNGIIGLISLLQDSTDLSPMQKESLRLIVTSSDLLLTVVNDVLDYSKLESGNVDIEIKKSNLQETLDAIVHSMELKGQSKNLVIDTFYDDLLPEFVHTDSRRLQQILYNLLGNAVKFSKDGGTIEFGVSICSVESTNVVACPVSEEKVNDEAKEESRCPFHRPSAPPRDSSACPGQESKSNEQVLRFVVKDYGKGIPEAEQKRIFQPFHQATPDTEELYGGTGLGLAIASKLVHGLGGSISVDSKEGQWAKFTVEFPLVDAIANVQDIGVRLKGAVVALVHSNPDVVARLRDMCKRYQVDFVHHQDMGALATYVETREKADDPNRCYICLVHEDLYQPTTYHRLGASRKLLLTIGPKFGVKEAKDHYRSLLHVIPSVLMQSICSHLESLVSTSQATVDTQGGEASAPIPMSDLKVLIAEDNHINQKVLLRMLKRLGVARVDIVDNGQKAVDQVDTETYDVIFMDMQMPVMDGVEACRLIVEKRAHQSVPKVVFVTAHVESSFELEAARAGGSGFLAKPYNVKGIEKCFQTLQI